MPFMTKDTRDLWLWLLNDGRAWSVADLARQRNLDPERTFVQLNRMAVNGHLQRMKLAKGGRYLRYAVTGTCKVPIGMSLAEVQCPDNWSEPK